MIRVAEINDLTGLVGFRQSLLTEYAILDADNLASSSGLFVGDVSGLITVKNIKQTLENPNILDPAFNTYLKERMDSSFVNLLKAVYSDEDLIENKPLFQYENDWTDTLDNATDFVGYEIDVAKAKNINVVLNKIMLSFNAVEAVKILLFHSSKIDPLQSKEITTVKDSTKHETLNWNLPNSNSITGGKYYIGYLRSGLTAKSYNREYESSSVQSDYNCLGITPIQVNGWDAETLFDVNDIDYVAETWGLNFDISSYWDYTSVVVENKDRFARGLQLQIAADLLNVLATSTNSNRDERMVKLDALFDLNGNRSNDEIPKSMGILNQLRQEITEIRKFSKPPKMQINTLR